MITNNRDLIEHLAQNDGDQEVFIRDNEGFLRKVVEVYTYTPHQNDISVIVIESD